MPEPRVVAREIHNAAERLLMVPGQLDLACLHDGDAKRCRRLHEIARQIESFHFELSNISLAIALAADDGAQA